MCKAYFTVLLALFAALLAVLAAESSTAQTTGPEKPNIVLILTDDATVEEMRHMPNVQKHLVKTGTTFTNSFVTTATCCPSRASTLRGQYTHNHGVLHNVRPQGGYSIFWRKGLERSNMATWMQGAGYETALFGKYMNGYCDKATECGLRKTHIPRGWSDWQVWTGGWINLEMNVNGRIVDFPDRRHPDVILRDKLFRYADKRHRKPFFMLYSTRAPHTPLRSPRKLKGMFRDVHYPRTPSFNEADVSDKPHYLSNRKKLTETEIRKVDRDYRERLRMLTVVDRTIPGLVARLKKTGEFKNTVFVFTSDNGYHYGNHRHPWGKNLPYTEDMQVPLVVSGPGIAEGVKRDELVLNSDLAPTFADMGRAKVPNFVDGRSFKALASGTDTPWRERFLFQGVSGRTDWKGRLSSYKTVRTKMHSYTEYRDGQRELYDLTEDPYQLENVAGQRPEVQADLAGKLRALKGCAGASCREAEN